MMLEDPDLSNHRLLVDRSMRYEHEMMICKRDESTLHAN